MGGRARVVGGGLWVVVGGWWLLGLVSCWVVLHGVELFGGRVDGRWRVSEPICTRLDLGGPA